MQKKFELTNNQIGVLQSAVDLYGKNMQIDMVSEECAELIKAVCKAKRASAADGSKIVDDIVEEAADVYIMLTQLAIMFPESFNTLKNIINSKVGRLSGRIKESRALNIIQSEQTPEKR